MKKIKKPIIQGYDWGELIPHILNKNYDSEKDQELLNELRSRIEELSILIDNKNKTKKDLYDIKITRRFIDRLAWGKKRYCYDGEIFKGLSRIKDNSTFLRYVSALLENCWV
jgi:hypothetical protein